MQVRLQPPGESLQRGLKFVKRFKEHMFRAREPVIEPRRAVSNAYVEDGSGCESAPYSQLEQRGKPSRRFTSFF